MTTHRKDKSQRPSVASQPKVTSLLQLTELSAAPVAGLQGEALERALREKLVAASERSESEDFGDGDALREQPAAIPGNSAATVAASTSPLTTAVDVNALNSLQADFFCDSRTPISDAAIAEQMLTCGVDMYAVQRPAGVIAERRRPQQSEDAPADLKNGELASGLEHHLIRMRNLLLQELQTSFADLQTLQKTAWAEQHGILKSLSAELKPGFSTGQIPAATDSSSAGRTAAASLMAVPAVKPMPLQPVVEQLPSGQPGLVASPERRGSSLASATLPAEIRGNAADKLSKFADIPGKSPGGSELQRVAGKANGSRTWEDIRKALLSECEAREHGFSADDNTYSPLQELMPVFTEPSFPDESDGPATPIEKPVFPAAVPDEEFLGSIPVAIDPETLSDIPLRDAFREREGFLSILISRFRSQRDSFTNLLTLEQLRELQCDLPADMVRLVTQSLRRLDELTKLGELEMAFERARIARLKNQLQQSRQQIEVRARQMGLTLNDDGTLSTATVAHGKTSNRRWLTKLGLGH